MGACHAKADGLVCQALADRQGPASCAARLGQLPWRRRGVPGPSRACQTVQMGRGKDTQDGALRGQKGPALEARGLTRKARMWPRQQRPRMSGHGCEPGGLRARSWAAGRSRARPGRLQEALTHARCAAPSESRRLWPPGRGPRLGPLHSWVRLRTWPPLRCASVFWACLLLLLSSDADGSLGSEAGMRSFWARSEPGCGAGLRVPSRWRLWAASS